MFEFTTHVVILKHAAVQSDCISHPIYFLYEKQGNHIMITILQHNVFISEATSIAESESNITASSKKGVESVEGVCI